MSLYSTEEPWGMCANYKITIVSQATGRGMVSNDKIYSSLVFHYNLATETMEPNIQEFDLKNCE